jgi:SulP family sulfate permease
VFFRSPEGKEVRIRSMMQQTMVGEMGIYRMSPRGASVVVDEPAVVFRLTRTALDQMETASPALACAFHKFVIRTLAERIDFANREVAAIQR